MTQFPQIVLGSRNRKKIGEIAELFSPYGIELIGVSEFPHVEDVVEDGNSFAANAEKKATEVAKILNRWVIAEDSGLCVDALGGAPGIYSARYAGEHGADVLSDPPGQVRLYSEGRCGGYNLRDYRGEHGFGYDPLFLVPEFHQTFGQLSPAVKRHISHRAKAFERLIPQVIRLFENFTEDLTK